MSAEVPPLQLERVWAPMQQGCMYVVRDTHPQLDNSSSLQMSLFSRWRVKPQTLYIHGSAKHNNNNNKYMIWNNYHRYALS